MYQRYLISRMNLFVNKGLTSEEFQVRLKEFDEFTEWLWNHSKKGGENEV